MKCSSGFFCSLFAHVTARVSKSGRRSQQSQHQPLDLHRFCAVRSCDLLASGPTALSTSEARNRCHTLGRATARYWYNRYIAAPTANSHESDPGNGEQVCWFVFCQHAVLRLLGEAPQAARDRCPVIPCDEVGGLCGSMNAMRESNQCLLPSPHSQLWCDPRSLSCPSSTPWHAQRIPWVHRVWGANDVSRGDGRVGDQLGGGLNSGSAADLTSASASFVARLCQRYALFQQSFGFWAFWGETTLETPQHAPAWPSSPGCCSNTSIRPILRSYSHSQRLLGSL
eukprot:COSAG02_NODE_1437_length_12606_cov_5.043336_4_plen_283_part_00